ncbi:7428_t:CDS:2 [Cetraspora pellucida]|uniref:7428_t:CDS:1 n=1 Tax=Cetraspora pellucida TaxID=1433469 RepID=A0A9N9D052_9GLOM|nr:7428_t:CDS:2 [Cetraspora pellucida]
MHITDYLSGYILDGFMVESLYLNACIIVKNTFVDIVYLHAIC